MTDKPGADRAFQDYAKHGPRIDALVEMAKAPSADPVGIAMECQEIPLSLHYTAIVLRNLGMEPDEDDGGIMITQWPLSGNGATPFGRGKTLVEAVHQFVERRNAAHGQ